MKRIFLTLDFEEWTTVEYLKKYHFSSDDLSYCALLRDFPEYLKESGLRLTVFAVGEAAKAHPVILRSFADAGCAIGLHSLRHTRPTELSDEAFRGDVRDGRKMVEDAIGGPVVGFRAPCFAMELGKLDILWEEGFLFDSSYIAFRQHKLYHTFDISSYEKTDSAVYEKNGRYEFEIPTLFLFGSRIPISGGGYFRLFPPAVMRAFYRRYSRTADNFLLYLHPYELNNTPLPALNRLSPPDRFRFQVGRAYNPEKLRHFLDERKKEGVLFQTMPEYIAHRNP